MLPSRLETPCLVEPTDLDEVATCWGCGRTVGESHAEDCFVPQQLVQVRATVDLIVALPRGWDPPRLGGFCTLAQLDPWSALHPRLSQPVGLEYVGPAPPAVVQALASEPDLGPEVPAAGGVLPWCEPTSIPFRSRAELDAHREICSDCHATGIGLVMHAHGPAPVWSRYRDGVLLLICTACVAPLVAVTVE